MVSKLVSCVLNREFEPRLGQANDYNIGIYYFSVKHASLRSKSQHWLSRSQDNVSEVTSVSEGSNISVDCCCSELLKSNRAGLSCTKQALSHDIAEKILI